jgi:hypothetical protein
MERFGEPAHYIVFHPEVKRCCLSVNATALVGGPREDTWTGQVWLDKPPGNEDPFVLGPSWAYSYCHATQLQRKFTPSGRYVSKGSCILFCSGDLADREKALAVDTVYWIDTAHEWAPGSRIPQRYSKDVAERTDLWKFHLRFAGQPEGHTGKYTYEAALHPQLNGDYSRLPLGAGGKRVSVKLDELSGDLRSRIKGKIRGKYPVLLSDEDLREVLRLVEARTHVAVIGGIMANDPRFKASRNAVTNGCKPCQPKTSANCG